MEVQKHLFGINGLSELIYNYPRLRPAIYLSKRSDFPVGYPHGAVVWVKFIYDEATAKKVGSAYPGLARP